MTGTQAADRADAHFRYEKGPRPKPKAVKWLRARPEMWALEEIEIAHLLKAKGFYAKSTYAVDIRVGRLVAAARKVA